MTLPKLVLITALALPATAFAQDDLTGTVSVAPAVKQAQLKKGVPVKLSCSAACHATVTMAGPIGIVTTKTVDLGGGPKTIKLKAQAFQVSAMKKGQKYSVTMNTSGPNTPALASDSFKVK